MTKHKKNQHDDLPEKDTVQENMPEQTLETVAEEIEASTPNPAEQPAKDPLTEAQSEIAKLKDKYMYLTAEYDNFRRRAARDMQEARTAGMIGAVDPILNVFDTFRMAMTASEQTDNIEKIREGLTLILNAFNKSIADLGIESIEALGQAFDPNLHEAISSMPSDEPEGTIIQQWSCGYSLNGKLLRPARVVVSAGPAD